MGSEASPDTPSVPASAPVAPGAADDKVVVLRGRRDVEQYLASASTMRKSAKGLQRLDAEGWRNESVNADDATWQIARQWGVPALSTLEFDPDPEAMAQLTPEVVRRLRAVPLMVRHGLLAVALEDAGNARTTSELDFLTAHRVVPVAVPPQLVREAIAKYYDHIEDESIALELGLDASAATAETSDRDAERLAREQPVVRMVADLIESAAKRRASDIHLRPGARDAEVLYRIDGEMLPVRRIIRALYPAVVSRVKVIAGMNLAEHRRAQDGRTTFALENGRRIDLRISVLPAALGESVVLRLMDTTEGAWNLEQIGMSPADRVRLDDVMSRSHGMFLATGPTGCGKSTTLYAMLLELRKRRINILTIEDPIEMRVEGIEQMQVNRAADFTFASALRNFLRHDPDVIMVGEIRDRETANIAVESALTGHLLLSTLHTNTAAAAITRLLDLGLESYLLRASLAAVMAQRLVRLTCEHCRVPEQVPAHVRELFGIAPEESFLIGEGCARCDGLGVHRRQAVYELLVVTPAMRKLIAPRADEDAIQSLAIAEGMTTITDAAIAMARSGKISLAEAWRVRVE